MDKRLSKMQKLRNSLSITAGAGLTRRRCNLANGSSCKPIPESIAQQQQQQQQQTLPGNDSVEGGSGDEHNDEDNCFSDQDQLADNAPGPSQAPLVKQVAEHTLALARASPVPRGILDVMPYYEYLQIDPAFKAEKMLWDEFHDAAMARWRQIGRDKHVAGGKCCARGCNRDAVYAVLDSMNFLFLRKITSTNQISSDALWKQVCV